MLADLTKHDITKLRVCVVGRGPAAAYAILALEDAGVTGAALEHHFIRTTAPVPVNPGGAFFLHWLPRANTQAIPVRINGIGTPEGYSRKQWDAVFASSFPSMPSTSFWYNPALLEELVWARAYSRQTLPLEAGYTDEGLRWLGEKFDLVLYTHPTQASLQTRSVLQLQAVAIPDPEGVEPLAYLTYDGTPDVAWVRRTVAWGRITYEYPVGVDAMRASGHPRGAELLRLRDLHPETPPLREAEWLAPNVVPVGRWANWDRGLKSHQAYEATLRALQRIAEARNV